MKAVIQTGGKQYLVTEGQQIKIEKIDKKAGDKIFFEKVLLVFDENAGKTEIGTPFLNKQIEGKVLEQKKDKKIIVFKYKPKKRYKVKKGHRQTHTIVEITKIGATLPSSKKEPAKNTKQEKLNKK